jgi:Ca2+-binding RTX toxin-like protein
LGGGPHDDQVSGASGTDRLIGGLGNDLLRGEEGNDSILGELGLDTMIGGDGDDFIYAADGVSDETVDCGPGTNDMASVDAGDVVVKNCESLDRAGAGKAGNR